MKAKVYQTTSPFNDNYFDMWKELSNNLPFYNVLEGTKYMYLIVIPSSINPVNIFTKYGVKTLEPYEREFDDEKFNSNYQIGIGHNSDLIKPFINFGSLNGIIFNEDGYPLDENNKIIEGSQKFYPVRHGNPYYFEPFKILRNMMQKL